jgi:methyl coenzyme M reductase alpha subunit
MFETMLREMLLKLIREDDEFRGVVLNLCSDMYDNSVKHAVKYTIENDEQVQDVIRKQATTDIGELITDMIERDEVVKESISTAVHQVIENSEYVSRMIDGQVTELIENLTFEVSVR